MLKVIDQNLSTRQTLLPNTDGNSDWLLVRAIVIVEAEDNGESDTTETIFGNV